VKVSFSEISARTSDPTKDERPHQALTEFGFSDQ
jgi:hypothetical protein